MKRPRNKMNSMKTFGMMRNRKETTNTKDSLWEEYPGDYSDKYRAAFGNARAMCPSSCT